MYSPAANKSQLILSQVEAQRSFGLTIRCETDCRTALARGLAEYLEQLSIEVPAGRLFKFSRAVVTYGEGERDASYPAASVHADASDGEYGESKLGNTIDSGDYLGSAVDTSRRLIQTNEGLFAMSPADFSANYQVEVWANDPEERMWLVRMLEDDFNPVEWMSGFTLTLPHYHNARGVYLLKESRYEDSSVDTRRRIKKAILTLSARTQQIRVMRKPFPTRMPLDVVVDGVTNTDEGGGRPRP